MSDYQIARKVGSAAPARSQPMPRVVFDVHEPFVPKSEWHRDTLRDEAYAFANTTREYQLGAPSFRELGAIVRELGKRTALSELAELADFIENPKPWDRHHEVVVIQNMSSAAADVWELAFAWAAPGKNEEAYTRLAARGRLWQLSVVFLLARFIEVAVDPRHRGYEMQVLQDSSMPLRAAMLDWLRKLVKTLKTPKLGAKQ